MTPTEAQSRYHWCRYNQNTNTIELYLDHYMLSCLRTCEAKFYLEHLLKVKPRYADSGTRDDGKIQRKPWFFDFGEYIHWCLEQFYNNYKVYKIAPPVDIWLTQCKTKWQNMKLDDYANSAVEADIKKYDEVKGWEGVCGLLAQYYAHFMDMRLRVIDTEITFGHNKEVFIGSWDMYEPWHCIGTCLNKAGSDLTQYKVKCYLTGRIDLLVDNGYKIGPVDHKTTHKFDGFEHKDFNPHDAMTGYIYAIHEILNHSTYDLDTKKPQCMGGWIYHISACTPSTPRDKTKQQGPRFKTTPVDKTLTQFEDYKARNLSTFKRVAELLFNNKTPEWTTNNCHNMFFRDCEYVPIHEQPSEQWQDIINRFYTIGESWDTRDHSNKDESKNSKDEKDQGVQEKISPM